MADPLFLSKPEKPAFWSHFMHRLTHRVPAIRMLVSHRAAAKLNLYFHVLRRRDDGYHDIDGLNVFLAFGDKISVRRAQHYTLYADGPFANDLPAVDDNLITRAVYALAAELNIKPNVLIEVQKNIPIAAGLGGGSADVAAVIRALAPLWGFAISDLNLPAVARRLGADIPVCLESRPVFTTGIGDVLHPAPAMMRCPVVLVNPRLRLITKDVFDKCGTIDHTQSGQFTEAPATILDLVSLLNDRQNDLMGASIALVPEILQVYRAILKSPACLLSRMTGSGPTCFGLYATAEAAKIAAAHLRDQHPDWWVQATEILASPSDHGRQTLAEGKVHP